MDLLRSRPAMFGAAAVLLLAIVGGGWLAFTGRPSPTPTPMPSAATPSPSPSATPSPQPTATATPEPAARCPLNGLALTDPERLDRPALAVQIENHPLARPV